MKGLMPLLTISGVLLVLSQIGGWSQGNYVPKPDEEIYGTWTNEKSINPNPMQKEIITSGEWKEYFNVSDSVPADQGTRVIDSKWTDSEGNIFYKTFGTVATGPYKGLKWKSLNKLSEFGKVQEAVVAVGYGEFDSIMYPTKIDPRDPNYKIYYRAGE